MKEKNRFRLIKTLIKVAIVLLVNIIFLLGILQLSYVQTRLGRILANNVSKKTGFVIKIGQLDIQWLDKMTLRDVAILDRSKNEMIKVENLLVDYRVSSLLGDENIIIDKAILDHVNVNLIISDSLDLNITEFIDVMRDTYSGNGTGNPKPFIIRSAILHNGTFSYNYEGKPFMDEGFDYNHFGFDSINTSTQNLTIVADTFNIDIESLTTIERSTNLPIHSFACDYRLNKSQMLFNGLNADIGSSIIRDSLEFNYNSIVDLNDFINKVQVIGKFDEAKIATQDLKYFAPYFDSINDTLLFSGIIQGRVNDFRSIDLSLKFGNKSHIKGNVYFEGLPDVPNTFMDLKFVHSDIYKSDIAPYIKSESFETYAPIDSAIVNGSFTGYVQDFVTFGSFTTSLGTIRTDLNLKITDDPTKTRYSGSLKLEDFDIGSVSGQPETYGKTTLEGNIKGAGISINSADFVLNGKIDKIRIKDYTYTNIQTNAHFAFGLFDGSLKINDPNLQFETNSRIDLRNNRNQIQVKGKLHKAILDSLNLRSAPSNISANVDINVKGIALDSIVGNVNITDLYLSNNGQSMYVNKLILASDRSKNERVLTLNSDRIDVNMIGNFHFTSAYFDIINLWKEYKFNLLNQEKDLSTFYNNADRQKPSSNFKFDLKLYDINPLLNLFIPDIRISEDTQIGGELKSNGSTEFSLSINTDTITYEETQLLKNKFELTAVSDLLKRGVEAKLNFTSENQTLNTGSKLENFNIGANWKYDTLDFVVHLEQEQKTNINNIIGRFTFGTDTTYLSILPSTLQVLEEKWHIQENNKFIFTKDKVELSNVKVFNKDQEISATGFLSKNGKEPIEIHASHVDMSIFNPLLPNELDGELNGIINISDIYSSPLIEANLTISNFTVDGFIFGDIEGKSTWNNTKKAFDIGFNVEKEKTRLVQVNGTYKPLGDTNALNLKAQLIGTDLQIAEPFTKGLFSNIKGSVSGNVYITGELFKPVLTGNGNINNASLTIDYLKTTYDFGGKWSFRKDFIELTEIELSDRAGGTGLLNAQFTHNNFYNFSMDLKASFKNLITLNTEAKDNSLYYGTTVGTGELSITGPIENIVINARAKTDKGTRFYIPLSDSGAGVQQEDFISFKSFTKKGNVNELIDEKDDINLSGITFNLDVEINPDAYAEIIFDLTAGDIIRGRGTGNLSLAIDTKGEFTVIGEYEFTEGAYNFTMYNIVNKEFTINPKSKIVWSGDPYEGEMDIHAVYKVNTTLEPLMVDSLIRNLPEVKRIYPSYVLLDLDGPLMSPDINFDIILEDYPKTNADIDTQVKAFLNKVHNDEQEMNRQVFSLLVLRKFSEPNSFSTGGTLGSSVSEFVSNQLSYWISQVDENLTIDIDLGNLSSEALQTFQLRVSYAFLDGKLIVTRDGGFTDQNQQATLASVTGDWTVEYLLSQDGKLRVKLFKKTNYDQLSSSTNSDQDLITGGFSLLYTTSFDDLKELFNKKEKPAESQETTPEENENAIKPEDSINTP